MVDGQFWAPRTPISASYKISLNVSEEGLSGEEAIRSVNKTDLSIHRLCLHWNPQDQGRLKTTIDDKEARVLSAKRKDNGSALQIVDLDEPLDPGRRILLKVCFQAGLPEQKYGATMLDNWHPRLWWGYPVHDNFELTLDTPRDYRVAVSGAKKSEKRYVGKNIRRFGIVLGKGLDETEKNDGHLTVSALFTSKARPCVDLLVDTAVDVAAFYRERFGFYPQPFLRIVPGMAHPAGGFPFATGIVSIHGQERFKERKEDFWRWITAHEIGHQYWGEHVLEGDDPAWLSIGLGIYADREYSRARGLDPEIHKDLMGRYLEGVPEGLDTTVDRPPEQLTEIDFDHNNIVVHGKGFSIISALETILGREIFQRTYSRCLREFGGRRLGVRMFQSVCEEESCQDLGWFFSQWVRSNRILAYRISSIERKREGGKGKHLTVVRVERLGSLSMPIMLEASFKDESVQRKSTDRLLEVNDVLFESAAELVEARLDPDGCLPLLQEVQKPQAREVIAQVREIPWTGSGKQALELFHRAKEAELKHADSWLKLGLALYDGRSYGEAFEAFRKVSEQAERALVRVTGWVWQGHILDLSGDRRKALAFYRRAKKEEPFPGEMRHDQYGIVIDARWVDDRLKEPFRRIEARIRD